MTLFTIGTVFLNVRNLDTMLAWYQEHIGLQVHWREGTQAGLGVGTDDLLVLTHTPNFTRSRQHTGLFHFALLVPDRVQLANTLAHLVTMQTPLQGMSDHVVSEALYLADPEGNGIEIYRDRPREAWYDSEGHFLLDTLPLDWQGLRAEIDTEAAWDGLPTGTIMGHIHLHVTGIPAAEHFYVAQLGMESMLNMGSATFLAYDGYHHHVGANIWGGRTIPTDDAHLGLTAYNLHLLATDRERLLASLENDGVPVHPAGDAYYVRDTASNTVVRLLTIPL